MIYEGGRAATAAALVGPRCERGFITPLEERLERGKTQPVRARSTLRAVMLMATGLGPAAYLHGADTPQLSAESAKPLTQKTIDVQQLAAVLQSQQSTPAQKDDAAAQLISQASDESKSILRAALVNPGNIDGQIAVARAFVSAAPGDSSFIPMLNSVLGANPRLTDAAAQALAMFQDNSEIFPMLRKAAENTTFTEPARAAVARAMGGLNDRAAAGFLVKTMAEQATTPMLRAACMDALADMTGLRDFAQDRQRWKQWWDENTAKNDSQWKSDLLNWRGRALLQDKARYSELTDGLAAVLSEQYALVADSELLRTKTVQGFLKSTVVEVRRFGARQIAEDFLNGRAIQESVSELLRGMIGDRDRSVRLEVAQSLKTINDRGAAKALVQQLSVETDTAVKVQITKALGRANDLVAVPELVRLLSDSSFDAAISAAAALAELGPQLRKQDPVTSKSTADALTATLETRTANDPAAIELRAACITALASLHDPRTLNLFRQLLNRKEAVPVRVNALRALGELGDEKANEAVASALNDENPLIKLEAVRAMKNLATFAQAELLNRMLDPKNEPDLDVRAGAWEALKHLLRTGNKEQLTGWPDQFKNSDPEKYLDVLLALRDADARDHDSLQLAITRQNVGAAMMTVQPPRAEEAAENFELALDYWRGEGKSQVGSDIQPIGLVEQTMDALLTAKKYSDAITFASKQIAISGENQRIVGVKLRDEADRLMKAGDKETAMRVIDESLKMSPALNEKYQNNLKQIRDSVPASGNATGP